MGWALALACWLCALGPGPPAPTSHGPASWQPSVAPPAMATLLAPTPDPDRWLAEDKLRHFAMSFSATQLTYGAARIVWSADSALHLAAAATLAAGIGKEVVDLRRGHRFSALDLVWDVAGLALGVVLVHQIR